MQKPAKFLVVIDAAGEMVARLFDDERRLLADFDASSSEVAVMTESLNPQRNAGDVAWDHALGGHSAEERAAAEVFILDV